jgi:hypothetical protein
MPNPVDSSAAPPMAPTSQLNVPGMGMNGVMAAGYYGPAYYPGYQRVPFAQGYPGYWPMANMGPGLGYGYPNAFGMGQ